MIDNITMDMEPDPNWAKIHDPDPKSLYTIWIHNTGGKYSLSRLQMMATTTPFGNFFSSWIAWGARTSMIRRKIRPPHFPTDYGYSVVEPFHFDPALAPASHDGCSGSSSSSVVNFLHLKSLNRSRSFCCRWSWSRSSLFFHGSGSTSLLRKILFLKKKSYPTNEKNAASPNGPAGVRGVEALILAECVGLLPGLH